MNAEATVASLAQKNHKKLYKQLMAVAKSTGNVELCGDVEDCVQEAFLRLYAGFDQLSDHENLEGWLFLTARNLLLNAQQRSVTRRKHTAGSLDDQTWLENSASVALDAARVEEFQLSASVEEMLEQVRDLIGQDAYAFLLAYYTRGNSARQVGERHNLSEAGAWKRGQRLIKRIRSAFFNAMFTVVVSGLIALYK